VAPVIDQPEDRPKKQARGRDVGVNCSYRKPKKAANETEELFLAITRPQRVVRMREEKAGGLPERLLL